MTYLQLINDVLIRLRESETGSVGSSSYVKLIGKLVNDAKRTVEDSHQWSGLYTTTTLTTVAGTESYEITGSNGRGTVYQVIDTTSKSALKRRDRSDYTYHRQLDSTPNGRPSWYRVRAQSDTDPLYLDLYPVPDSVLSVLVEFVDPQADLSAAADTLTVPSEPVILRALAYAMKERGEDQGAYYAEALQQYREAIGRAIILDEDLHGGRAWQVP